VRRGVNLFLRAAAASALWALLPLACLASEDGAATEHTRQAGENRWVPSLAITSGVTIQKQHGFADSVLFEDMNPDPVPLQGVVTGNDLAVSPFVGGSLELMAPALPIPTRPRLFASGEILPTFASDRDLAVDGDPSCVRGPEPNAPCANSPGGLGGTAFDANAANGQGTSLLTTVDTLVFGANLGAAFPLQIGERQLRIKPSFGWINYKLEADGYIVDAECGDPNLVPPSTRCQDFLRETRLSAGASQRFNGIGPGIDVEMETVRYGPVGVSLFLGGRAYAVLGGRSFSVDASESFDDTLGMDVAAGHFEVKVAPWIFRAHVGVRFSFVGNED
jgi:hypothetical protein